jgi:hypothetical protein
VYYDQTELKYEQEIGAEIRQQQKLKKAIFNGPRPDSSPRQRLRAYP